MKSQMTNFKLQINLNLQNSITKTFWYLDWFIDYYLVLVHCDFHLICSFSNIIPVWNFEFDHCNLFEICNFVICNFSHSPTQTIAH